MPSWSRDFVRCQSCSTQLFRHKAKGYCERCYRVEKEIQKLQDLSDQELHKRSVELFGVQPARKEYLSVAVISERYSDIKLRWLKLYGAIDRDPTILSNILVVEEILNEVARQSGRSLSFFDNKLMGVQSNMPLEQRAMMCKLMLRLLVSRRASS